MSSEFEQSLILAEANERLRQEGAAFDTLQEQYAREMRVRRAMLWTAVILLPAVMSICIFVLVRYEDFDQLTVAMASGALFVDALGLVIMIWRATIRMQPPKVPAPITQVNYGVLGGNNS